METGALGSLYSSSIAATIGRDPGIVTTFSTCITYGNLDVQQKPTGLRVAAWLNNERTQSPSLRTSLLFQEVTTFGIIKQSN